MTGAERSGAIGRALFVEKLSIAWMLAEGAASIVAGVHAHSVALVGFGADSALELIASVAVYGRLRAELRDGDRERAERREKRALWVVGVTLLGLCIYILGDSGFTLWKRAAPENSPFGLAVAAIALVVMPVLAGAKRRLGEQLGSRALIADAKESLACAWLSGAVVVGVGLHAAFGWWWADPVAALVMVPFVFREGREAIGEARGGHGCAGDDCDES